MTEKVGDLFAVCNTRAAAMIKASEREDHELFRRDQSLDAPDLTDAQRQDKLSALFKAQRRTCLQAGEFDATIPEDELERQSLDRGGATIRAARYLEPGEGSLVERMELYLESLLPGMSGFAVCQTLMDDVVAAIDKCWPSDGAAIVLGDPRDTRVLMRTVPQHFIHDVTLDPALPTLLPADSEVSAEARDGAFAQFISPRARERLAELKATTGRQAREWVEKARRGEVDEPALKLTDALPDTPFTVPVVLLPLTFWPATSDMARFPTGHGHAVCLRFLFTGPSWAHSAEVPYLLAAACRLFAHGPPPVILPMVGDKTIFEYFVHFNGLLATLVARWTTRADATARSLEIKGDAETRAMLDGIDAAAQQSAPELDWRQQDRLEKKKAEDALLDSMTDLYAAT